MRKHIARTIIMAFASAFMTLPSISLALDKIEGNVVGTKLTACDFASRRCEGYLTLDTKAGAKADSMSIRVIGDTAMTKGSEKVLLPTLRGSTVAVTYVKEKGENLAKSIEVLQSKK
ncbi:MAG TPA: hypothetical protein VGQ82_03230 [Chthoniobacterales bacterium]|nr:hypothetical protein [Chthoniobacterales bacterium]